MTMHLERGLTTLNTKKRPKKKLSFKRLERIKILWRSHNKFMKKIKATSCLMSYKDYIKYMQGTYRPKRKITIINNTFSGNINYTRDTESIPLSNKITGTGATKKERMVYSGERKLLGIATMHKSNLVPVWAEEDAKDIARMRR